MSEDYPQDSGVFISVEDALRLVTWYTNSDHPMNSAEKPGFTREQNEQALREAHENAEITLRDAASMRQKNPSKNLDTTRRRVTAEINSSGLVATFTSLWISGADVRRFAELRFVLPHFLSDDLRGHGFASYDVENELGYTIRGAAKALANKYAISEDAIRNRIFEATCQGKLQVRDPQTGLPYVPKDRSHRYERIGSDELNRWLEESGVPYRLGDDSADALTATAATGPRDIDRNRVMHIFSVRPKEHQNEDFWDDKLSRPPEWLKGARTVTGKPGRSSRWDPRLVGHALLAKKYMTLQQLDSAIHKHLPDLLEQWKTETGDVRESEE